MPKPWAKYEVDFINHPKFRALQANAICLWIEGKNYCDENMTDGLIPAHIVKQFRFSGKKSIEALLASCGLKNGADHYAPLWEAHAIGGYKMHDYLEYNDSRDVVLGNIAKGKQRRVDDRERLKQWRDAKRTKRETSRETVFQGPHETVCETVDETPMKRSITDTATATDTTLVGKEHQQGGGAPTAPPARPMAPIHDRSHHKHAICGRVCLHASLFNDFVRRRNTPNADQEIRAWAAGVIDAWTTGVFQATEPGDSFEFWKARYAETWPMATAATASKTPAWVQKARANA